MSGISGKSKVIQLRLPNEIVEIVEERIARQHKWMTVASYLRGRIIYDITRKHYRPVQGRCDG